MDVSEGVIVCSCFVLCVSSLFQVVSIEKMEDTSLLPNPIIVSIRSKMAFQFIELRDRENLVEGLLLRLKQVHANHPVHYETSPSDDDMVGALTGTAFRDSPCNLRRGLWSPKGVLGMTGARKMPWRQLGPALV